LLERSGQSLDIADVPGGDYGSRKLKRRRHDEGIDSVGGGELGFGQEVASPLGYCSCELSNDDPAGSENVLDRGIETRSTTHFGEHESRYSDDRAPIVRHLQNGAGAIGESPTLG